jgi:hypothetical protein
MTRLWSKGVSIVVQSGSDSPEHLIWQSQTHHVAAVVKQWRVNVDWWRGESVARDYYKVTTTTGLLLIIYRDLQTGAWYLQRLYD